MKARQVFLNSTLLSALFLPTQLLRRLRPIAGPSHTLEQLMFSPHRADEASIENRGDFWSKQRAVRTRIRTRFCIGLLFGLLRSPRSFLVSLFRRIFACEGAQAKLIIHNHTFSWRKNTRQCKCLIIFI